MKKLNFSDGKILVEEHYSNGILVKKMINGVEVDLDHDVTSIFMNGNFVITTEEMTLKQAREFFGYPHQNDTN